MSNVIDLLLNADLEQIERPSKEVEIKRLSNALGEKFTVLCKALSYDKYSEIQENCIDMRTKEPRFTLIGKLADPDADGVERIVVKNVSFDDLTLMDWEVGAIGQSEHPFTATAWEVLDSF